MDAEERERQILKLQKQIEELERLNSSMFYEIKAIKAKLEALQGTVPEIKAEPKVEPNIKPEEKKEILTEVRAVIEEEKPAPVMMEEKKPIPIVQAANAPKPAQPRTQQTPPPKTPKSKSDWERFIGENLINKIGILITVIGVGIGTKYAIDHELISIEMRIILGYLLGGGLLALSLRLKGKYADFSAVLLSGSMAIFYFLTFISYSFYHFFPIGLTFALMILFTAFTVLAAVKYERVVIAHLGLVGAYGIPFLLSDGSGKVGFFYSYIALINLGILIVSFFKNWKSLQYASYGLTWVIFLSWYGFAYVSTKHFDLALLFLFIFFVEFYAIGLVYKLVRDEKFAVNDIFFILGNSFLFFALGYNILATHGQMEEYLGLFCALNAVLHFIVAFLLYRKDLIDKTILYLVIGMVMLFITITVPVQFEGNVVTITWSFEALMLFVLARYKKVPVFEWISYPVFGVAFISLLLYWIGHYSEHLMPFNDYYFSESSHTNHTYLLWKEKLTRTFLFNANFLTSFCFLLVVSGIFYLNKKRKTLSGYTMSLASMNTFHVITLIILLFVWFMAFFLEIGRYWEIKSVLIKQEILLTGKLNAAYNGDVIQKLAALSKLAFVLFYVGLLLFIRGKKHNVAEFKLPVFILSTIVVLFFMIQGVYLLRLFKFFSLNGEGNYLSLSNLSFIRIGLYLLFASYVVVYLRFVKNQFKELAAVNYRHFFLHGLILVVLLLELSLFWDVKKLALAMHGGIFSYSKEYFELELLQTYALISKLALPLLYLGTYFFVCVKRPQTEAVKYVFYFTSVFVILMFLTFGLYHFSYLQMKFLYVRGMHFHDPNFILVRFAMYTLFAVFFVNFLRYVKKQFDMGFMQSMTEFILHVVLIWVISSELVNWMHMFNSRQVYKLTLSIFWGIYAMGLVSYGIWKRKTPLRIGAISLFGLTLVKLFLYDLVHLSTLSKTIVFIVLGLLLLAISFLYNRYKTKIFGEDEK